MKKRNGEKIARVVKTGTGAVIAAGVIAVFCGSRVPLKNTSETDIVSSVLPVSTSVSSSFSRSVESTSSAERAPVPEPPVEAPEQAEEAPEQTEEAPEPSKQPSTVIVNINTATLEELKTLSGIGDVKAAAILAYREEHGAFGDIGEIMNVSGIGDKLFEDIRDNITVGKVSESKPQSTSSEPAEPSEPPIPSLINLNTATLEELQRLSGIGEVKAAAIIAYREEHGAFSDIGEIVNVSGIGEKTFEKIRGKITV